MIRLRTYDLVFVADDLGETMRHFPGAGEEAIVLYSYTHAHRTGEEEHPTRENYALWFRAHGFVAWYHRGQLRPIEAHRPDLLDEWQAEWRKRIAQGPT